MRGASEVPWYRHDGSYQKHERSPVVASKSTKSAKNTKSGVFVCLGCYHGTSLACGRSFPFARRSTAAHKPRVSQREGRGVFSVFHFQNI